MYVAAAALPPRFAALTRDSVLVTLAFTSIGEEAGITLISPPIALHTAAS